tara:strand:- start:1455 stop:1718 length:264 start_codon:yes stop_codon:yes gene_type:complete
MKLEEKAIQRLRKGLIGGKEFLIVLFIFLFLASFCYWCYELYYIHTHDFDLSAPNDVEILEAAAHEVAAFQACILAFLFLAFLIYFL